MIKWQNISKPHLTGYVEDMESFKAIQKLNGGGLKVVSETSDEVNAIVQDAIVQTSPDQKPKRRREKKAKTGDETETV